MVSADLEGLVSAHHQPGLVVLLVPQQPHVASTTLLPFLGVTVKSEQLGAHLEGLLLELLVGLCLNLLGQANDGLEVNFGGLRSVILVLNKEKKKKLHLDANQKKKCEKDCSSANEPKQKEKNKKQEN